MGAEALVSYPGYVVYSIYGNTNYTWHVMLGCMDMILLGPTEYIIKYLIPLYLCIVTHVKM